jgi:hypothetical protein
MIQGQNALPRMPAFAESHERGTVTSCDDADAGGAERCRLTAMSLTIAIGASLIKAR